MREFVRPAVRALSIACLAVVMAVASAGSVLAQAKQAPPKDAAPAKQAAPAQAEAAPLKQIALTEKQVEGVLSAAREMDLITEKIPENAKPDPKIEARLDAVAKKNGFASYDEYNSVADNISLVLAGFDPATRQYVGTEAVIKGQIALVQADKKMSPKDKKEALADLDGALKTPGPAVENKGNIDIVGKYYDKLAEMLGEGDQ